MNNMFFKDKIDVLISLIMFILIIVFALYFILKLNYYDKKPKLKFHNNEIEVKNVVFSKRKLLSDDVVSL